MRASKFKKGITLIEMTLVILVLLILTSLSVVSFSAYRSWSMGLKASEVLKEVYNAQRTYLSENPTVSPLNLTAATVSPYLSYGEGKYGVGILPNIDGLDGSQYTIDVTVSPPVITGGYDPSGNPADGLWDVGQ